MKWYFENIALNNELKRDHPAVTEMIESLLAQLTEAKEQIKQLNYEKENTNESN